MSMTECAAGGTAAVPEGKGGGLRALSPLRACGCLSQPGHTGQGFSEHLQNAGRDQ